MHLVSDYIHPYKHAGGRPAHCRVRIYLPDYVRDAPVVITPAATQQPWWPDHQLCGGDSRGSDPGQRIAYPVDMDQALAPGEDHWWRGDD
jgi:hypothetical protein